MKRSLALVASAALVLPTAAVLSPAEATSSTMTDTITNCQKTKYGVTVKIRIRDRGDFSRVRVSHPDGKGVFRNRHVAWVRGGVSFYPDGSTAISIPQPRLLPPSSRIATRGSGQTAVFAHFKLRDGHSVRLACSQGGRHF
jgi:hypothetical protein